jgi:hypothetical protein
VEEPASHRRVTPMVLNCGGFFVYLQDMIEAAHPIQNNEIKYCVMCLALHGEWTPSSCDVYSMDRGHHIPCCCDCCMRYMQNIALRLPVIHVNRN